MAFNGARKAALILMQLDPGTAGELLRSARPETITEIAAELTYLGASGRREDDDLDALIGEFCSLLRGAGDAKLGYEQFTRAMLESAMGPDKLPEALQQVQRRARARDPFMKIRTADTGEIARALGGEAAQVAALVLSELPPKKSSELLGLLEPELRAAAVSGMAAGEPISSETALRVATVVQDRLDEIRRAGQAQQGAQDRSQQLRKVAVLLRSLQKESRDDLLAVLSETDEQTGKDVQKLMVIWEDVPQVADRALQEVLRQIDAKSLALSLCDAPEAIAEKIRRCISERAGAMVDEEAGLLSSPGPEEIEQARAEVVNALCELNANGELAFEDS